jgi:hypothetical protein
MEPHVKIIFTVFAIAIGVAICFIDPKGNNAGSDWFWKGGRHDPIRNLICRPDGTFRRFTKVGILMWFAAFLAILWLVV